MGKNDLDEPVLSASGLLEGNRSLSNSRCMDLNRQVLVILAKTDACRTHPCTMLLFCPPRLWILKRSTSTSRYAWPIRHRLAVTAVARGEQRRTPPKRDSKKMRWRRKSDDGWWGPP